MGSQTDGEKGYSVSELARLLGVDRRTLAARLTDVEPLSSAAREKRYRLSDAVQGFISQPLAGQEAAAQQLAKGRKLEAEAGMAELRLQRERDQVLPVTEVRDYAQRLFRGLHNRIAQRFPAQIAAQLYKSESPAHVADVLQKELGRIFNEVREDHTRFLPGEDEQEGGQA